MNPGCRMVGANKTTELFAAIFLLKKSLIVDVMISPKLRNRIKFVLNVIKNDKTMLFLSKTMH